MTEQLSPQPSQPLRRDLKATMFWCARWLLGGDHYYRGSLTVRAVRGRRGGESLELRPEPGDEVYPADGGPLGDQTELTAKLLASFLSSEARVVMGVVADRGPMLAKSIVERSGIERSRAYLILGELKERGLITDGKDGYELADRELWATLLVS